MLIFLLSRHNSLLDYDLDALNDTTHHLHVLVLFANLFLVGSTLQLRHLLSDTQFHRLK